MTKDAEEKAALMDLCQRLLTDLQARECEQGPEGDDRTLRPLSPADRLAQREVVKAVLEARPNQLTTEDIVAERLQYGDCDRSELHRALAATVDLELLRLDSTGLVLPSCGLLRIDELWEDLCAAI